VNVQGTMLRIFIFILISASLAGTSANAAEDNPLQEIKFDPGTFIFDHIGDAYEWHLFTIGDRHFSIPLPVILYSREKGLNIFMSSKFKHGHATYRGFAIIADGPEKGKIYSVLDDGRIAAAATRPLDLSITKNVTGMLFAAFLMTSIFLIIGRRYQRNPLSPPRGVQSLFEPLILFVVDDIIKPGVGEKKYIPFLPYLLTLFFFIWINNMLGLIPIFPMGANVTGNISVTAGLALTSFIVINLSGNRIYWQHIFNAPNVPAFLKYPFPLMQIIEVIGMITKPFVLMIRLFANITAGHIITMGFFSLIFVFAEVSPSFGYGATFLSVGFGIFITVLELLVALIQAYVFTLMTSLFIGAAIDDGH
jgi:F-type H+-transporting ATPase subunit a